MSGPDGAVPLVWERTTAEVHRAATVSPYVGVAALELAGVSRKRTAGSELTQYLVAFERLVRAIVLGRQGVIALDLVRDASGFAVRLLAGCPAADDGVVAWRPDQHLERFRLEVARAFSFRSVDAKTHLDVLRPLETGVVEPARICASHDARSATSVLPLAFSFSGMGGMAQMLEIEAVPEPCCLRTVIAPPLNPSPEPEALMPQLASADELCRDPEVPYAVAYRARGVRRALERALDTWLGQHCAIEVQVRAGHLSASSQHFSRMLCNELARAKDDEVQDALGRRRTIVVATTRDEYPDIAQKPTIRVLAEHQAAVAPVPSFWTTGGGERPKHLSTVESAVTLIVPPLPAYCDLPALATTFVEQRPAPRPAVWLADESVGVDVSGNPIAFDDEAIGLHVHVMGVPGSGKTTAMRRMILGDLRRDRGFVVLDPHSDLARRTIADIGFEPVGGIASDVSFPGLSLLSAASSGIDAVNRDIGVILEAIESALPSPTFSGPVFRHAARSALMLHAHVGVGKPIGDMVEYFEDEDKLRSALSAYDGPSWVKDYFANYLQLGESVRAETNEWVTCKLIDYFRSTAARALFAPVGGGMTACELADQRVKMVVDFSGMMSSIHDTSFLGQLFLLAILRNLMIGGQNLERRMVVYLDEVQLFMGPSVEMVLREGRKYGLFVVAAHQASSQLAPQRFDALVGQVGLELLFRCSLRDAELLAGRLDIDGDALTAMPDFQCWLSGTIAERRGGGFLMTTSL